MRFPVHKRRDFRSTRGGPGNAPDKRMAGRVASSIVDGLATDPAIAHEVSPVPAESTRWSGIPEPWPEGSFVRASNPLVMPAGAWVVLRLSSPRTIQRTSRTSTAWSCAPGHDARFGCPHRGRSSARAEPQPLGHAHRGMTRDSAVLPADDPAHEPNLNRLVMRTGAWPPASLRRIALREDRTALSPRSLVSLMPAGAWRPSGSRPRALDCTSRGQRSRDRAGGTAGCRGGRDCGGDRAGGMRGDRAGGTAG
jgi:hypothetical protein